MAKNIFLITFFVITIGGCFSEKECSGIERFLGKYEMDTMLLKKYNYDSAKAMSIVKENKWDEVILVSEKNKYHFINDNGSLQRYEGRWEYKESGRDGDCFFYIYQNEDKRDFGSEVFNIAVKQDNKSVVLPFRKKGNVSE